MARRASAWRLRDTLDLTVIAATHGLSDGFSSLLVPVPALIVVELGLSTFEAGLPLSIRSVSTFLFLYPLSMLADSSGRKREMLILGLSLAAGAYLAMGAARSLYPIAILAFLAGAGNATYHPCGAALTAKRFGSHKAMAISLHGLGGNIGASLMPLLQSAVVTVAGWRTAVGACALPAALLLPLIGIRFSRETGTENENDRGNSEQRPATAWDSFLPWSVAGWRCGSAWWQAISFSPWSRGWEQEYRPCWPRETDSTGSESDQGSFHKPGMRRDSRITVTPVI